MTKWLTILSALWITLTVRGELTVFAAASMMDAMREISDTFEKSSDEAVRFNFASTGALARQIEAGAPVDIFISANAKWMDWLEDQQAVQDGSRLNLAANTLVMIAPAASTLKFDGNVKGRIAVGDFRSVPAGMYAEEALAHMGWLDAFRPDLVMASNVRTALLYVERGEVAAGIVYSSDAKASAKIKVIGIFPAGSHAPILYPAAAISKKESAIQFLEFLRTEAAKTILTKHGFSIPETDNDIKRTVQPLLNQTSNAKSQRIRSSVKLCAPLNPLHLCGYKFFKCETNA